MPDDIQITIKVNQDVYNYLMKMATGMEGKPSPHKAAKALIVKAAAEDGQSQDTLVDEIRELREVVSTANLTKASTSRDRGSAELKAMHADLVKAMTYVLMRLHPEREQSSVKAWIADNLSGPTSKE